MRNWANCLVGVALIMQGLAGARDAHAFDRPTASRGNVPADRVDVHSWGNPHEIRVKHVALDLTVDFDARRLTGTAELTLERLDPDARFLFLDARDLKIDRVEAPDPQNQTQWKEILFEVGPPQIADGEADRFPHGQRSDGRSIHGEPLLIELPPDATTVRIHYATDPSATALQWLEPAQTAGGEHPFLFTQSQAIHARSWIPLQDSPGVRVTYEATIRVPRGLKAVMSARGNFQEAADGADGVFQFNLDLPIPPYLIALGVGDLAFRPLGPRTGVYAEPALVEKAAWEFADTEAMIEVTEKRFGPYRWGRYDLLVLPPSFPFGGMENPCLTFATPTILAGDRSLVSLVAHELAHSWSGNLVTNATWSDFWLNEGFTTYIENRIIEDLYGPDRATMESVLGLQGLREELKRLPEPDQILKIDLSGRDPDEGVTGVPYEKGKFLLYALEKALGREAFDNWIRNYFDKYAFQSIPTSEFERALTSGLPDVKPNADLPIDLQTWLEKPGLPPFEEPRSDRFARLEELADRWTDMKVDAAKIDTSAWTTQEWLHFLRALPADLPADRLAELDAAFSLTDRQNSEIAAQWLEMAIRGQYRPASPRLEEFLTTIGRRKFLMPLYRALIATPEGRETAVQIYKKARPRYHPIAVESIDQLLGTNGEAP